MSVVIIKSLSTLRQPLLPDAARTELLNAVLGPYNDDVRRSLASEVLHHLPHARGQALKVSQSARVQRG